MKRRERKKKSQREYKLPISGMQEVISTKPQGIKRKIRKYYESLYGHTFSKSDEGVEINLERQLIKQ